MAEYRSRKLEGQIAIITGASSGIGAGIARAFAQAGAKVVINYSSSEDKARSVLQEVQGLGSEA
ncbi:MAG TPA: SDR family NAD(P)-dependent oxidoreductase, partial [Chryseosolibacter sp.]|nr:SDR family NAD(P)-dependent oxidoreductase [Chryseosolibacter sp.]